MATPGLSPMYVLADQQIRLELGQDAQHPSPARKKSSSVASSVRPLRLVNGLAAWRSRSW